MLLRCIAARYVDPSLRRVVEGDMDEPEWMDLNASGYNVYYLPNAPTVYTQGKSVDGSMIDTFQWVFVDMDLKDGKYPSKNDFIEEIICGTNTPPPTKIVDTGGGIHAYWKISGLDAISYLRLTRRLMRKFDTDEAVGQIFQLMRLPGSINVKEQDNPRPCELVYESEATYTAEELDKTLPPITQQDEAHCQQHYNKTYNSNKLATKLDDTLPTKFGNLVRNNKEVKDIWSGNTDDRSKADYRLGHIMFANGFSKAEALSVLVNSPKAMTRSDHHRVSYADNIIDKIWTFEIEKDAELNLSSTVREILTKNPGKSLKGERFPCHRYLDATEHGFRLGQVIGLVAGSGVGKTAMALNMFMGFVQANPDHVHFFVPLEQPANEIAERWQTMCGPNTALFDKVHVLSNYGDDGAYRRLSFSDIKEYLALFQAKTKQKIGCVVVDHIGALKKSSTDGRQSVEDICHEMKGFAIELNVLLVMQSQAPREKAGIGDLDLNKDAAYGTVFFESYCDYLITIHQPLKRCYNKEGCPTITAFKFCKIRHKKKHLDSIQEDTLYRLYFDPETELMRTLTTAEEKSFDFYNGLANSLRKLDRKTDILPYSSITWVDKNSNFVDNKENIDNKVP